jgi:hypothetical protein
VSRRVSLPDADELFRSTAPPGSDQPVPWQPGDPAPPRPPAAAPMYALPADSVARADAPESAPPTRRTPQGRRAAGDRRPTGRERHDEKITVYVSAEELVELEHARLTLRAEHGLAIDRGRIVREALAVVLADLDAKADNSILVRRLTGR